MSKNSQISLKGFHARMGGFSDDSIKQYFAKLKQQIHPLHLSRMAQRANGNTTILKKEHSVKDIARRETIALIESRHSVEKLTILEGVLSKFFKYRFCFALNCNGNPATKKFYSHPRTDLL